MTSAPGGIEDAVPMLLMRSPSTRTTALAVTLPVPSMSFPNRIALTGAPAFDTGQGKKAKRRMLRLTKNLTTAIVRSSVEEHRLLVILVQAQRRTEEGLRTE